MMSIFSAPAILLVQLFFSARFVIKIQSYRRGLTEGRWHTGWLHANVRFTRCFIRFRCCKGQPIAPRRLDKQLAFLTRRFAPHAPGWQLVIWLRQLALFLLGFSAERLLPQLKYRQPATFIALRLVFASLAIITTLAAWRYHRKWQPYYYRFQNSIETWLYASTVALILLACIYSALPPEGAARIVLEMILLIVLLGSLLGAAGYALRRLYATRHTLASADLSSVLLTADAKIDADLKALLGSSTIRLLRCSWLMSDALEAALGTDERTGARFMPRFQDLPSEAFFSPEEAVELFSRGDRSVLVLSYGWNRCAPPSDPTGFTLAAVRRYLANEGQKVEKLALFWE